MRKKIGVSYGAGAFVALAGACGGDDDDSGEAGDEGFWEDVGSMERASELGLMACERYAEAAWLESFEDAHKVKVHVTLIGLDDDLLPRALRR